jgi:cold shock protein
MGLRDGRRFEHGPAPWRHTRGELAMVKVDGHPKVVTAIFEAYMNDAAHKVSNVDQQAIGAAVQTAINTDVVDARDPRTAAASIDLALRFGNCITKPDPDADAFFTLTSIRVQKALAVELGKASTVQRGTVKWFDQAKGFGFIKPDSGGMELFAHHSEIVQPAGFKTLLDGQRVEFRVGYRNRTLIAKSIRVI